jgi:hypothetical protein
MHTWQPSHRDSSTVLTFPFPASTCSAPVGQASTHPGLMHCRHMARTMSSGKHPQGFCTICILDKDRSVFPSCTREQASIQDMQPLHFFLSTTRYPSDNGAVNGFFSAVPTSAILHPSFAGFIPGLPSFGFFLPDLYCVASAVFPLTL